MAYDVNGKQVEMGDNGYLLDPQDWSTELALLLAQEEGIELTQEHWDILHYLREEFINHNGHQPNDRELNKFCSDKWGRKVTSKEVYALFPGKPSKQAGKIAGLPETLRKGGY